MGNQRQLDKVVEAFARREEIQLGRPLLWAVQFGLIALIVTVFWLLFQGEELGAVFERGVVGFLLFAGAGYAAGRLLERPPAVAPLAALKREKPGTTPGTRRLGIDQLRPGMVLAEPIPKPDGEILIAEGSVLSEPLLGVMREYEVTDAVVNVAAEGEEHYEQAAGN